MERIKVVWLCHFSNSNVHDRLELGDYGLKRVLRGLSRKPLNTNVPDYAVWITNGIQELEKMDDVELHVVSPYPHLKYRTEEYQERGVYYHFFHNEDEGLLNYFLCRKQTKYRKNRKTISRLICRINPDIVHVFGLENPHYSLGLLDVPNHIPTIAQLQTLLNDPAFSSVESAKLHYRANTERVLLSKASFVGTVVVKYREIIKRNISSSITFINTTLPLAEPINKEAADKEFDFVYYASNIQKACDLAIEAFALAKKKSPSITMDIVGGFDSGYKAFLDKRIQELNISDAITFEGSLLTHDDVIRQIRKSRFALLPLKVDITSGTIREAMSNGLPVVTTDTGELGTQKLNLKRQNALISSIGDHQALAENMLRLLNDESLADALRQNAFQTRFEANSNEVVVRRYVDAYKACIDSFKNGTSMSEEFTKLN